MDIFTDDEPQLVPNLVFEDDLPSVSLMSQARDALHKAESLKFRNSADAGQLFSLASTGFLKVLQHTTDPLYNIDQLSRLASAAVPTPDPAPINIPLDESWMGRATLKGSRNSLYESVKLAGRSDQMDAAAALQDVILLEAKLADIGLMPHSQIHSSEIPSPVTNRSDMINAALGESFLYLSANPMSKSFFPATVTSETPTHTTGPYGGRKKANPWSVMPWGRPPIAPRSTPQGMESSAQDFMTISPVSNSSVRLGSQSRDADTQAEGMFRLLKSMETLTAENNNLLAKIEELSDVQRENAMLKQQMDEFKADFQNRLKRIKLYLKENKPVPPAASSSRPPVPSREQIAEEEDYKKRQIQMEKTIKAMLTRLEEAQAELEAKNHKIRQYEKMNKRATAQAIATSGNGASAKGSLKAPLSPPSPRGRRVGGIAHEAKRPTSISTAHQPINSRRLASSPSTTTLQSSIKRDHMMHSSGGGRVDHMK